MAKNLRPGLKAIAISKFELLSYVVETEDYCCGVDTFMCVSKTPDTCVPETLMTLMMK